MKNLGDTKLFQGYHKVLEKIQALLDQREMIVAYNTAMQIRIKELKALDPGNLQSSLQKQYSHYQ